jgi:hypothetical protein
LFEAIEIRLHTFVDETSADGPILRRIIREFFVTRLTAVRALRYGHVLIPARCGTLHIYTFPCLNSPVYVIFFSRRIKEGTKITHFHLRRSIAGVMLERGVSRRKKKNYGREFKKWFSAVEVIHGCCC